MESAIVSIVSLGLVIFAAVTMMMHSFSSVNSVTESWLEMEQKAEEIRRTDITLTPPDLYTGGDIDLLVTNEGETDLADFSHWDIITRYQGGGVSYVTYSDNSSPEDGQWVVKGIYLSDNLTTGEIFDLDVLNPGETAWLQLKPYPVIAIGEYGRITASTENGVTAQCNVYRH